MEFNTMFCPECGASVRYPVGASSVRCNACKNTIPLGQAPQPKPVQQDFQQDTAFAQAPMPDFSQDAAFAQAPMPQNTEFVQAPVQQAADHDAVQQQLADLEAYMQLQGEIQTLQPKLNQLRNERNNLQKEEFKKYVPPKKGTNGWPALCVLAFLAVFVSLIVMAATLAVGSFICFGVFLLSAILTVIMNARRKKEIKDDQDYARANYDLEKDSYETGKSVKLTELNEQIAFLEEKISAIRSRDPLGWMQPQYKTDEATQFIYNALLTNQAMTIQQAMYQYSQARRSAEVQNRAAQQQLERERIAMQQQQQRAMQQDSILETTAAAAAAVVGNLVRPRRGVPQTPVFDANSKPAEGKPPRQCPVCGSRDGWNEIDQSREGFNVGSAILGAAILGPVGLVAGAAGNSVKTYHCIHCGFTRKYKG